jgi:hypothetical protein
MEQPARGGQARGDVAKWQGRGLQSPYPRFESGRRLQDFHQRECAANGPLYGVDTGAGVQSRLRVHHVPGSGASGGPVPPGLGATGGGTFPRKSDSLLKRRRRRSDVALVMQRDLRGMDWEGSMLLPL